MKYLQKQIIGDIVCYSAVVAICLALALPRYRNGMGLGDEGFLAYGAMRVLEGQLPNKDFFSLQPPLSFYTAAIFFKLFGPSLITLRKLGLCIHIIITVLVYALARQLSGRIIAFAAGGAAMVLGMPFFFFVPFAVWHGVVATLATALLVMKAVAKGQRWWAFFAGLTTSLIILSRHDQSFYLAIAVLAYALVLKFAKLEAAKRLFPHQLLGMWAAGVAVVVLPVGVYWFVQGAVPFIFEQLVLFPLIKYPNTSSLPMPLFHVGQGMGEKILVGMFYLPPVVQVLTGVVLLSRIVRRRFSKESADVSFILVLSVFFYYQVITRSDLHHLLITLAPLFVLCAWWLEMVSRALYSAIKKVYNSYNYDRWLSFTAIALVMFMTGGLGVWFMSYTKPIFLRYIVKPRRILALDRGGVRLNSIKASSLENVIKQIRSFAPPDRSILCLPYQSMLYFLSERRNPTRWNDLWPNAQTREDHLTLIKQAQADPPAVVLIFEKSSLQVYAPAIINYVESEYKIVDENVESEYKTADRSFSLSWYLPLNRKK